MRNGLILFCLITSLNAFLTPSHAQQKLIFNTVNFPPYEIEYPEGDGRKGFDVELLEKIFQHLDTPIEIEFIHWKRGLRKTISGLSTGIFSCSARDNFYLSDPISTATDALFFKSDFDFKKYPIESIKDLTRFPDLKVGGVAGYKILEHLDEFSLPYETSADDATAFEKLFAGRFDIFLTTKEFATFTLNKLGLSHLVTYKPLKYKNYHVCFSKSWDNILGIRDDFNKVLKQFRQDGTYDAIHDRYR